MGISWDLARPLATQLFPYWSDEGAEARHARLVFMVFHYSHLESTSCVKMNKDTGPVIGSVACARVFVTRTRVCMAWAAWALGGGYLILVPTAINQ